MPVCNCLPKGFQRYNPLNKSVVRVGPSVDSSQWTVDQDNASADAVQGKPEYFSPWQLKPPLPVPRYLLYQTAQRAYWNFYVKFFNVRDIDNGHFMTQVMGPSGTLMINKVLGLLTTPGNIVKLDVGTYQQELVQVSKADIEYFQSVFINTYGPIEDFKVIGYAEAPS